MMFGHARELDWRRPCDRGLFRYVSPRERPLSAKERRIREVAYGLKDADAKAIRYASRFMAGYLPPDVVLVPIPTSTGSRRANMALAEAIARKLGARVADVLRRERPVESSRARRIEGRCGLRPEKHGIKARYRPRGNIVFIDNVITTGSTVEAARRAIGGRGCGLAFARAREVPACEIRR